MQLETIALDALQPVITWVEEEIAYNYFLAQVLKQPHYLEAVWVVKDPTSGHIISVLAKRKSGNAHYFETTPCMSVFEAGIQKMQIRALLMPGHLLKDLPASFQGKPHKQTSVLMTRQPARIKDTPVTIETLSPTSLAEAYGLYRYMNSALPLEVMQMNLQAGGIGVGVKRDDQWVGLAQINSLVRQEAFLYGVIVHPDWRGKGIGHDLMRGILKLTDEKAWRLHLLTDSMIAQGLYAHHGFVEKGQMIWLKYK